MLEVYQIARKYDVINISESYLDSTVLLDDNSLSINSYKLTCADHLGVKRGSVCMYYKGKLSLRIISTSDSTFDSSESKRLYCCYLSPTKSVM